MAERVRPAPVGNGLSRFHFGDDLRRDGHCRFMPMNLHLKTLLGVNLISIKEVTLARSLHAGVTALCHLIPRKTMNSEKTAGSRSDLRPALSTCYLTGA